MSKESYIGGDAIEWIGGKTTEYLGKATYSSGKKLVITADGIKNFGDNPETQEIKPGNYITDGYWSRDFEGNQRITEAKIGDQVHFQIHTQNIPVDYLPDNIQNKLSFGLYTFRKLNHSLSVKLISYLSKVHLPTSESKEIRYEIYDDRNENKQLDKEEISSVKPYNSLTVDNNKAVISIILSEALSQYFTENRNLQLYIKSTYFTDLNILLPETEEEFLKVELLRGDIIFQKASQNHPFPMIFDSETGDPYYIEARKNIQKSLLNANKIKGILLPSNIDPFTKKSYEFALRRLKAGELIFNDGSIGKAARFYENTVASIDRNFSEKIVMGVNKGNFTPGVTSKGINQLEAFSSYGKIAKSLKFVGKVLPLFSAVMDLSNMAVAVGNGEKPPIPFMPPFVTMEVEKICNDIAEFEYNLFFNGLNNVLFGKIDYSRRGISVVELYIQQWNSSNAHAKYNWKVVRISQSTLEKLMNGEIKKIENINDLISVGNAEEARDCGILAFTNYEESDIKHYIYATFLPEIIE